VSEVRVGPKRSLLAQGRSRDTRQAIIKAALELWSERGYDTGIDDTTAEEIAARAGVAKATFYFHFARKDDILLETGWLTAKVFYEDTLKALLQGGSVPSGARASAPPPRGRSVLSGARSADEVIDAVTVKLCRRVERVPRLALRRMLRAQSAAAPDTPQPWNDPDHFGFRRAFAVIFLHAQQIGDVPQAVTPDSLGAMFEAQLMSAMHDWAHEHEADLLATLRQRFAVLLAGARAVNAFGPDGRAGRGRNGRRPVPRRDSHTENEFTREE
jgi:AcrR family transcriptional regulator